MDQRDHALSLSILQDEIKWIVVKDSESILLSWVIKYLENLDYALHQNKMHCLYKKITILNKNYFLILLSISSQTQIKNFSLRFIYNIVLLYLNRILKTIIINKTGQWKKIEVDSNDRERNCI